MADTAFNGHISPLSAFELLLYSEAGTVHGGKETRAPATSTLCSTAFHPLAGQQRLCIHMSKQDGFSVCSVKGKKRKDESLDFSCGRCNRWQWCGCPSLALWSWTYSWWAERCTPVMTLILPPSHAAQFLESKNLTQREARRRRNGEYISGLEERQIDSSCYTEVHITTINCFSCHCLHSFPFSFFSVRFSPSKCYALYKTALDNFLSSIFTLQFIHSHLDPRS